MQQRYVSPCMSRRGGCLSLQMQGIQFPITQVKVQKAEKSLKKCKVSSKAAGGTETVKSDCELEKTAAGNLCSGIQATGKSVISEASKLWELAWLFKLLPGIVCPCWQKHIFFPPWRITMAICLCPLSLDGIFLNWKTLFSYLSVLLHNPDVKASEFTDRNFYTSTY